VSKNPARGTTTLEEEGLDEPAGGERRKDGERMARVARGDR
jgi:hypothetical protein